MSFIPIGQKRLTNIQEIRYKIKKQIFEIACFQNKVIDWRNKNEQDINEVLQSKEIFTNLSQGEIASNKLLNQYFPKMSKDDIIIQILNKGEMQLGEKERNFQIESMTSLIINYIAENCVHPDSNRLFSQNSIKQAIKDIHFQVVTDTNEKVQAKKCIKILEKKYLIQRADMEIEISSNIQKSDKLAEELNANEIKIKKQYEQDDQKIFICITQPSNYKILDQIKNQLKGKLRILNNLIVNNEILDIEQMGNQNLQLRPEYIDQKIEQKIDEKDQKIDEKDQKIDKKDQKIDEKDQKIDQKIEQLKIEENDNQIMNEQKILELQKLNPDGKKCQKCKYSWFNNNNEFRQHCKSEWHLFNQQKIIKGLQSVTFEDFQKESLNNFDSQFFKK